ncbi:g11450 [Coccomyxa elongata]
MSHLTQPLASLSEDELRYLQPILEHIHQHFCAGKGLLSEYLLNWLAYPLQQLGDKTGVAVVVKGQPGTDKGVIFNVLMGKIYGEHYVQCKDIHDLTGGFNSLIAKKMLVNLDEATFGGLRRENQMLKNFITEPRTNMTEKFKDSVQINSYVNLVITTNEDFPVAITEGDRRYFVKGPLGPSPTTMHTGAAA